MSSVYLNANSPSVKTAVQRRKSGRALGVLLLAFLFATLSIMGTYSPPSQASADDDGGFIKRFACWFDEGTIPRKIYQTTQTSDLQFALLSKSAIGTGTDNVSNGLNSVLNYINRAQGEQYTYEKRNEIILGEAKLDEEESGDPAKWNKGRETLNPFDRFGVAGLRFSSYGGEWKHLFIDACANENLGSPNGGEQPLTPTGPTSEFTLVNINIRDERGFSKVIDNVTSNVPTTIDVFGMQEIGQNITGKMPGYTITANPAAPRQVIASNNSTVGPPIATGAKRIKPAQPTGHKWVREARDAIWATYASGFTVISTHFPVCIGNKVTCSRDAAHRTAMAGLMELVEEKQASGPVFITGDFNDGSHQDNYIHQTFQAAGYPHDEGSDAHPNHTFYPQGSSVINSGRISKAAANAGVPTEGVDHAGGVGWGTYSVASSGANAAATTTVATFNILGAGHTDGPNANRPGFPTWSVRLQNAFSKMESSGVTVAGLQEVHGAQSNAIKSNSRYKSQWGMYPTDGAQNKVVWKKSDWTFISGEKVPITYFNMQKVGMPVVKLRHNASGEEIYFWSIHNPISGRGGTSKATRVADLQAELSKVRATTDAPFFLVGDFNDGKDGAQMSHCILTPTMTNAFGPGSTSPCRKPDGSANIDHIYATQTVFSSAQVDKSVQAQKISDHPLVTAAVSLGASASGVTVTPDFLDPGNGDFYEDRLDPKSTWEDIPKSQDVRSMQFSKGLASRYNVAILTNLSNWIFALTKMIVVFTIALIGLAFSDIVGLLGINDLLLGSGVGADQGVYGALYKNLFGPLVIMAFVLTGMYMLWHGIVKRQYRNAVGGLIRAVSCFLIAVIISVSPAWFIALPNNVAVVTQSIIASTLNRGLAGGNGLCSSDVGVTYIVDRGTTSGNTNVERDERLLKKASLNMQSAVGCAFWQTFLFKPWVEGQFGVSDYRDLNGNKLGNRNGPYEYTGDERISKGWVGKPIVPLGHGRTVDNWALFQVSTQTNAHSPVGKDGDLSDYSQGVAQDWWRAVDAFSNYQEDSEIKSRVQGFGGAYGETKTITYTGPMEPQVLDEWDVWAGNSQGHRLVTALSSVLIAFIGVLAPLIFAGLSAVYAIGIAILMSFAPIMFLFGCWAGRGWEIFKAWGDLVVTTTIKRIVLGVLMVVSITITSVALRLMNSLGYWQGLLIMIILSIALVKSRHQIMQSLNFIRFSSVDFGATASRVTKTFGSAAGSVGKFGTAAAGGAVASKRYGGSFGGGALAGMKREFTNLSYRSPELRRAMQAYDSAEMNTDKGSEKWASRQCAVCGKFLNQTGIWESDELGYVCEQCVDDGRVDDATFVGYHYGLDEEDSGKVSVYRHKNLDTARSVVADDFTSEDRQVISEEVEAKIAAVTELAQASAAEVARYKNQKAVTKGLDKVTDRHRVAIPATPAEISGFVDERALQMAWETGNDEYVKLAYTTGWIEWARSQDPEIASALDGSRASDILQSVQNDSGGDWYKYAR